MYLKLELKKEDKINDKLPKRKTKYVISMNVTWKKQIGTNIFELIYKNPKTKEEVVFINKLTKKIMELKPLVLEKNINKECFDY